jgi:hypothetical protein
MIVLQRNTVKIIANPQKILEPVRKMQAKQGHGIVYIIYLKEAHLRSFRQYFYQ